MVHEAAHQEHNTGFKRCDRAGCADTLEYWPTALSVWNPTGG